MKTEGINTKFRQKFEQESEHSQWEHVVQVDAESFAARLDPVAVKGLVKDPHHRNKCQYRINLVTDPQYAQRFPEALLPEGYRFCRAEDINQHKSSQQCADFYFAEIARKVKPSYIIAQPQIQDKSKQCMDM